MAQGVVTTTPMKSHLFSTCRLARWVVEAWKKAAEEGALAAARMTDTNHAESQNEDGERRVGSCFGYAQKGLETDQRTDRSFGQASAGRTQESRSCHEDCTVLFSLFDIRLDMIVFPFLQVLKELRTEVP
jgi:hypothetical protein